MAITFSTVPVSRRALVGGTLAGAALLPLGVAGGQAGAAAPLATSAAASASPRGWRTWYLTSPSELRPPDPGAPTAAEIAILVGFQGKLTTEQTMAITQWGSGPPVLAWSSLFPGLATEFKMSGIRAARAAGLFYTALHDAALAAWDAQLAYKRPGPAATDKRITPAAGVDPKAFSFPSAHASVAGAAAMVLPYLFPQAVAGRCAALAQTACQSRE